MNEIVDIYDSLKPVIHLIEKNGIKEKINDMEDNLKVNDDDWEVLEEIRSLLWELLSAYERFEEMNNNRH